MLQIVRFRHVAIVVADLEMMLDFYTRTLGFQLKRRFDIQTEDFRKGIGIASAKARVAHIAIPGGAEIELFQFIRPSRQPVAMLPPDVPGFRHIAFVVDDIETSYSELTARGVRFFSEPVTIKEPEEVAGIQFVYFRDPEGNIIELSTIRAKIKGEQMKMHWH